MESTVRSFNRLALASFVCGLLSPVIFLVFVAIGTLQETGHYVFVESYRYEAMARILMLSLSVAAVLLAYRAKFQIAINNGIYRGATLAHIGRILGYVWGTVILLAVLRWLLRGQLRTATHFTGNAVNQSLTTRRQQLGVD